MQISIRNNSTQITRQLKLLLLPVTFLLCLTIAHADDASQPEHSRQQQTTSADNTTEDEQQLWNLEHANIRAVINQVSEITGKNFLIDPQVRGEVSIISGQPLGTDEVYPVFLSMLQTLGYTAVTEGNVVRILPNDTGVVNANLVGSGELPQPTGETIVQVIDVEYVPAEQLVPILRPLLPPTARIAANVSSNKLIVAGSATNVQHIAEIVARVDTFNANEYEVEVIPLQYGSASEMVDSLQSILSDQNSNRNYYGQITLGADDRSNTILLSGNPERRLYIRVLISQLDRRSENNSARDTEVIYLKYLQANDAVPILASVARANAANVGTTLGYAPNIPSSRPGFNSTQTRAQGLANTIGGNYPNSYGGGRFNMPFNRNFGGGYNNNTGGGFNAGPFIQAPVNSQNTSSGDTATVSVGDADNTVEIAAETNTNSITITGPTDIIRTLKSVLSRIDIRPAQVLVEALIVEISETRMINLGIDWTAGPFDNTVPPGGIGIPPTTPALPGIPSNMGSTFANFGTNFGMGFIRAGDIQLVIEALQQDSNTHVLSTPSLVVLDNQEAAISVGQTVPFPSGAFSTRSDSVEPFIIFDREDVALSLAVIPQINDDGSVSLQIFHENETIDPTSTGLVFNGQESGIPITNKSEIQTSVIVEDGDVLVLGGLISNQRQDTRRSTPFLGSIPIIGLAFQSRLNNEDRRNLMVFLRPRIITDPDDGIRITDRKYQYIRNQQINSDRSLDTSFIPNPWDIDIRIPEPFTPRVRS